MAPGLWGVEGGGGGNARFFTEAELERGMGKLLSGSVFASHRWHSWRRGAAFGLHRLGVGWEVLQEMGDWEGIGMARHYATPDGQPAENAS